MYLLPCSQCAQTIAVSVSKAGDVVTCSACGAEVSVPNLGELKRLPQDDAKASLDASVEAARAGKSPLVFISLGLIATAALLVAAYCGLRWSLIDIPITTESHIADYEREYKTVAPAVLIREYESMEKFGIEMVGPMKYVQLAGLRRQWGSSAATAAGVGLVSLMAAFALGSRKTK
jgi:hypothetical protein